MIEQYLNTNKKIEDKLDKLFDIYNSKNIDLDEAEILLAQITDISHIELKNIKKPATYFLHCINVSKTEKNIIKKINKNYPILEKILKPEKGAYFGLIHDFIRCIVNDKGQEIHEIIALKYLQNKNLEEIAYATGLHFTGPEILEILQKNKKFLDIKQGKSNYLDMLNAAGAISATKNLDKEDMLLSLKKKNKDIRERYPKDHLLIKGLNLGGEKRLKNLIEKVDNLCKGKYSVNEVKEMYNL